MATAIKQVKPHFSSTEALQPLLKGCTTWERAKLAASYLVEVAMPGNKDGGNMTFFKNMTQQILPVLLFAAAVMEEDSRRVERWLNRINDSQTASEIDSILRWKENPEALDIWAGFLARDSKLRSDVSATMSSVLVQVTQKGAWLGHRGVLYTGSSWDADDGAIWRRPALLNAAQVLRTFSDSRGRGLLARDVRIATIGCSEDEQEGLQFMLDAIFHDQSEEEAKRAISSGERSMRVPAVRYDSAVAALEDQQARRGLPVFWVIKPDPDAQAASHLLDEQLGLLETYSEAWTCPIIVVDLCQTTHPEAYERDIPAVTHYLDCQTAREATQSIEWSEPDFWTEDRWKDPKQEPELTSDEDSDDEEETSPPASLQLATIQLTAEGKRLLLKELGHDVESCHPALIVHALLRAKTEAGGDVEPLVVLSWQSHGLDLRPRYAPSFLALQETIKSGATAAWARVVRDDVPAATREVVSGWIGLDEASTEGRQIGEVLIWAFELSEYLEASPDLRAQVIVPTGRGHR